MADLQGWVGDKQSNNKGAGIYVCRYSALLQENRLQILRVRAALERQKLVCLGTVRPAHIWSRQWSEYSHQRKKKKTLKSPEYGPYVVSTSVHTALLSKASPAAPLQGILNPWEVDGWFFPSYCYLEAKDFFPLLGKIMHSAVLSRQLIYPLGWPLPILNVLKKGNSAYLALTSHSVWE